MDLHDLRRRWPAGTMRIHGEELEVVRTDGGGVPVLLLPGAQGTAEIWFHQLLAWGDRRTLVAVTYPALTDGAALADAVIAVADAIGAPRVDLVGTSLGGYVAQWAAVRHPQRIGRLVIGNSFCDPAPAQSPEKRQALESRAPQAVKDEALARLRAGPDTPLKAVQLELVGHRQSAELLHARMLAVQLAQRVPALGVDDERILVLECDDDPLIPPPMRAALREAHPRARHVALPVGGHFPYVTQAAAYNASVGAFLDLA
ncbi:MAG: alpha/beta hydrolase [Rubrivivax sp.]|nr:alpha/beta hydrolase [Rubrivivax sp.]